jgi:NADH-quinone oxidoreductase subunit A
VKAKNSSKKTCTTALALVFIRLIRNKKYKRKIAPTLLVQTILKPPHNPTFAPMLTDFGTILLFLIGGACFVLLGLGVSSLLRPHRPNPEKLAAYECGEEAVGNAWVHFNPRFYVIALLFVLFDVELAFLFPTATVFGKKEWIAETNGQWGWLALGELVLFIGILALGLAYAWRNGHFDWIKPKPVVPVFKGKVPASMYTALTTRYAESAAPVTNQTLES